MSEGNTDPGLAAVAELMDTEEDELGIQPTEDDRPEPDSAGEPVEGKGKSDDLEELAPEGSPDAERIERDRAVEAEEKPEAVAETKPEAEPETVESLQAKLAAANEQLQRQSDGFLRTITSLRQRNQGQQEQAQTPQPQQSTPDPAKPIPVETFFDDEGNLKGQITPEAIAQAMAQAQQPAQAPQQPEAPRVDPAAQLFGIQQSLSMQHQDKAPQVTRIFEAGARLDMMLTQKLMEIGAQRMPSSVDEARQVALGTGLDKALSQQYPELALEGRRFDDLLEGWMSLNPRLFEYLLQEVEVPDSAEVPPVHQRVGDDGKAPDPRPRSMADRGRSPDVVPKKSGEARLQEIDDQYPNLLAAPKAIQKEYARLVGKHAGSPRLTGGER